MAGRRLVPWLVLFLCIAVVLGSHFRGGIIMVRPYPGGESNEMEVSFHISWRSSYDYNGINLFCDQSVVDSRALIGDGVGDMTCQYGCFNATVSSMAYRCTDFSTTEDWSFGENRFPYSFGEVPTSITIGFYGEAWIVNGFWNISATFSLTTRIDTGRVNSSPRAITTPVIRLQAGCNHTIRIPTSDPDNDIVRCRWAVGSECAGVCSSFPGAYIHVATCTITYVANRGVGYKVAAIMIEDFVAGSTSPLSSVALQFLVLVSSSSSPCSVIPRFIPPTLPHGTCVAIPPNATFNVSLIANSGGSENAITEIQTVSPAGAVKSALLRVEQSSEYYVNITWTPQANQQMEIHLFCYTAINSAGISSSQQCINLLPGHFPPIPVIVMPNMQPVHPLNTTWNIRFDQDVIRPLTPAYITFHDLYTDVKVYQIDSSLSQEVIFAGMNGVLIRPDFAFEENAHFYINYERGIVLGLEGCRPGNEPENNSTFWVFETLDVTPPSIVFLVDPELSRSNITLEWVSDEQVTWQCDFINHTQHMEVNCSNASWSGIGLSDGTYQLIVMATDIAANRAQASRTFRVDITPPIASITSKPGDFSNRASFQFEFVCDEVCTFRCSFLPHDNDTVELDYSACNSYQFTTPSLNHGRRYTFYVQPTDEIGNTGQTVSFTWETDFVVPFLFAVTNMTILCTADESPDHTGLAQAIDNTTAVVSIVYTDFTTDCFIQRSWEAIDIAGNVGYLTQLITLDFSVGLNFLPHVYIACDSESLEVSANTATLQYPCGRPLLLTYEDSVGVYLCPDLFTRTWRVTDQCDQTDTLFNQSISLYDVCPLNACGRNETMARGECILGSCSCNVPWFSNNCDLLMYAPVFETVSDVDLLEAEDYIQSLTLVQGTPPVIWTLVSAPTQMIVSQATGLITWHGTQAGNYTITVQATNQAGVDMISWFLHVEPGYSTFLDSVSQNVFSMATAVQLSGHVEYSEANNSLGGVVPVVVDVTSRNTVRRLKSFTNHTGNFSIVFYPAATEYGSYIAGARHPRASQATGQTGWDFLGMRASPQIVRLSDSTAATYQNTFNNATVVVNDGPRALHNLTAVTLLGYTQSLQIAITFNNPFLLRPGDSTCLNIHVESTGPFTAQIPVKIETMEGVIVNLSLSIRIAHLYPSLEVSPPSINSKIVRGTFRNVEVVVTNTGSTAARMVRAILPTTDLISLISFGNDKQQTEGDLNISSGESAVLTVLVRIPPEQPLGDISGEIVFVSTETYRRVSFNIVVLSSLMLNFTVIVEDEYTYFAEDEPLVNGAIVRLTSNQRGIERVLSTEQNGNVTFFDIPQDHYNVFVSAPKHATVNEIVFVESEIYTVFLPRETVVYRFTVTQTTFEETYNITLEATFETRVPIPVVTITPTDISLEPYELGVEDTIQFNITNHGFIRAEDLYFQLPTSHPFLHFFADIAGIGSLDGLSSVIVPVTVTRTRSDARKKRNSEECSTVGLYEAAVSYSYVCGDRQFRSSNSFLRGQLPRTCTTSTGTGGVRSGYYNPISVPSEYGQIPDVPLTSGLAYFSLGEENDLDANIDFNTPTIRSRRFIEIPTAEGCDKCVITAIGCVMPLINIPFGKCGNFLQGGQNSSTVAALDLIGCGLDIALEDHNCILDLINYCDINITVAIRRVRDVEDTVRNLVEVIYPLYVDTLRSLEVLYDEEWLAVDDSNWLSEVLYPALSDGSDMGALISTVELAAILNVPPPDGATSELVLRMVDRVNNTLYGWANGILEPTETIDLASYSIVDSYTQEIITFHERAIEKGFNSFADAYAYAIDQYNMIEDFEEETGVCAVVRIRIEQELAITREVFLATLEIENRDVAPLEQMRVEIVINDFVSMAAGEHLFSISNVTLSGSLSTRQDGWTLPTNHSGSAEWFIVPYSEAAPFENHLYTIGGTWSYIINGQNITIPLLPTRITVIPDPSLIVHYFWEKYAIGDNPFTERIEPSVPLSLAVAIQNKGYGTATNLHIISGLPEIIDNEKGLVVAFKIIGTTLGNATISPTLSVDFGDIRGNTTKVARWWILSSLQGEFERYSAKFEYTNPLGDPKLSVLDELVIHDLVHNVQSNNGDETLDFLVNDLNDLNALPDALYTSNTFQRFNVSIGEVISLDSSEFEFQTILCFTNNTGWVYFTIEDTQSIYANTSFINVTKYQCNETSVLTPENAWITRDLQAEHGPLNIHIFDYLKQVGEVIFTVVPCSYNCPTNEQPFEKSLPPIPPISLLVNTVGSTWITFSWEQVPTLHNISNYTVIANGGGTERNLTVEGSHSDTNVTELNHATEYTLRVISVTEEGQMSYPSIALITTTAPSTPEDVVVDAFGFFWISLSWQHSFNVAMYTILLSGGGTNRNFTVDGSESNRIVTGLQPGTEYTVRVLAAGVYGHTSLPSVEIMESTLFQAITFPPDEFDYTVNETAIATFECSVAGIPPLTITWYKDGLELTQASDSRISLSNYSQSMLVPSDGGMVYSVSRTLMLANTTDNDSDFYTCTAANFDVQEFQLIVQIAPRIVMASSNMTIIQPNNVVFTCIATGFPRPEIAWFFGYRSGRMPIDSLLSIENSQSGERHVTSLLSIGTDPTAAGEYTCIAGNTVGNAEASAALTIHVLPEIQLGETEQFIVNVTDSITLHCNATGLPLPTIQWFREGAILDGNDTDGRTLNSRVLLSETLEELLPTTEMEGEVYHTSRSITVSTVLSEDIGTLTCNATNVAGSENRDFQLFVQVPPLVVTPSDHQTIFTLENGTETLTFQVINARPPVVEQDLSWYYSRMYADSPFAEDSVDITGRTNHTPQSTITFSQLLNNEANLTLSSIVQGRTDQEPTDSGRYFFVAVNPAGMNFSYIDLIVFGPPRIQQPPEDEVAIDGECSVFKCFALAFPQHNVIWMFTPEDGTDPIDIVGSQHARGNAKYNIVWSTNDTERYGELTVNNVQFQDRGVYGCTVENDYGYATANATLYVHVTPVINQTSQQMDVLLGMEVRLVCLATGYPHPDFTWQKDGHTIDLDNFMYKGSGNSRGSASGSGQHLLSVLEMRTRVLRFTVMNSIMSLPSGMGSAMDTDETYPEYLLTLGDLGAASVCVWKCSERRHC